MNNKDTSIDRMYSVTLAGTSIPILVEADTPYNAIAKAKDVVAARNIVPEGDNNA